MFSLWGPKNSGGKRQDESIFNGLQSDSRLLASGNLQEIIQQVNDFRIDAELDGSMLNSWIRIFQRGYRYEIYDDENSSRGSFFLSEDNPVDDQDR